MQTIGEKLEEARKGKGVSIREAAEATKIRGEYLNSFESNNFTINIPEIYVRGFLRNYCNFLKLNADPIVTDYDAMLISSGSRKRDHRELYGRLELQQPIIEDKSEEASGKAERESSESGESIGRKISSFFESIEKDLAIKIGVIAVAALLTILLLIWIVNALIGSGQSETAPLQETAIEQNSGLIPVEEEAITLIATGDLRVRVIQEQPRQVLFDEPLAAGEQKDIYKTGKVLIEYSEGKNLILEKDGSRFRMPSDGRSRTVFE